MQHMLRVIVAVTIPMPIPVVTTVAAMLAVAAMPAVAVTLPSHGSRRPAEQEVKHQRTMRQRIQRVTRSTDEEERRRHNGPASGMATCIESRIALTAIAELGGGSGVGIFAGFFRRTWRATQSLVFATTLATPPLAFS